MSKHTKGPWFADKHGNIWRRNPAELYENGGSVAGDMALAVVVRGWHDAESVGFPVNANANLIAAAPDLLEALGSLLDSMDANGSCQYEQLREEARAAIAKATGDSDTKNNK